MTLSIVVPVLDEAATITGLLDHLTALVPDAELVVVDGGSTDGTPEIVRRSGLARLVESPAGRGPQMNAGARHCGCEVLLFLHADVGLPANAPALIAAALEAPSVVGGAFRTHTVTDRPSWLM
jgi:glycosyltransferase involved in cell wall biosynthesis